jgi:hypothetical protein
VAKALEPPRWLGVGGRGAWREAVRELGHEDATRFRGAVSRYARAVDVAERARVEWVRLERPLVFVQPNKAQGQHPLVTAMMAADRQAGAFAAELGLTPLSAARVGPRRGRGRPVGAVSAPDRKALPPLERLPAALRAEPPRLAFARRGAVNRSRGLDMED